MESNWVDFKTIKQAVTIVPVLDRYGVKLKKSGKELRGRCPIHQGDGADSSTTQQRACQLRSSISAQNRSHSAIHTGVPTACAIRATGTCSQARWPSRY